MALLDRTHLYDQLKAPFRGHALEDLLKKRNSRFEFAGSASFSTEEEFHQLTYRDKTAPAEMKEIDQWTGLPKNLYTWEQAQNEIPTWAEIEAEHAENLAEYEAHEGKRARAYPPVKEQLDMLYKDIHAGLLGEDAKTSQFYATIKAIKDSSQ